MKLAALIKNDSIHRATGTLVEEVVILRLSERDPSSNNSNKRKIEKLQPDFVSSFGVDGKAKYDLLAVEIKKPRHHNHQLVPDKNKVPIELKQMLNNLVGDDIPEAKVAGVVINGKLHTLFSEIIRTLLE